MPAVCLSEPSPFCGVYSMLLLSLLSKSIFSLLFFVQLPMKQRIWTLHSRGNPETHTVVQEQQAEKVLKSCWRPPPLASLLLLTWNQSPLPALQEPVAEEHVPSYSIQQCYKVFILGRAWLPSYKLVPHSGHTAILYLPGDFAVKHSGMIVVIILATTVQYWLNQPFHVRLSMFFSPPPSGQTGMG